MATALGSSASVSTWGKFRCAWCFDENFDYLPTVDSFSIEYLSGQKATAAGSGLIRWNRGLQGISLQQPSISSNFSPSTTNRLFLIPSFPATGNAAATEEFEAVMVGQTVTMVSGSGTINSTLFDSGIQVLGGSTPYGDITNVGNLTGF
jgi:hypothetical protein